MAYDFRLIIIFLLSYLQFDDIDYFHSSFQLELCLKTITCSQSWHSSISLLVYSCFLVLQSSCLVLPLCESSLANYMLLLALIRNACHTSNLSLPVMILFDCFWVENLIVGLMIIYFCFDFMIKDERKDYWQ
jgi:hypothetical protein